MLRKNDRNIFFYRKKRSRMKLSWEGGQVKIP